MASCLARSVCVAAPTGSAYWAVFSVQTAQRPPEGVTCMQPGSSSDSHQKVLPATVQCLSERAGARTRRKPTASSAAPPFIIDLWRGLTDDARRNVGRYGTSRRTRLRGWMVPASNLGSTLSCLVRAMKPDAPPTLIGWAVAPQGLANLRRDLHRRIEGPISCRTASPVLNALLVPEAGLEPAPPSTTYVA